MGTDVIRFSAGIEAVFITISPENFAIPGVFLRVWGSNGSVKDTQLHTVRLGIFFTTVEGAGGVREKTSLASGFNVGSRGEISAGDSTTTSDETEVWVRSLSQE